MKKVLFFFACSAFLATANAALPEGYAGDYTGKFERATGTLRISKVGETLTAEFVGANGSSDLLGGRCASKIGRATEVNLDKDGAWIGSVRFEFDPVLCANDVEGRSLFVDFKHKKGALVGVNVSLYKETTTSVGSDCVSTEYRDVCFPTYETHDWYLTGSFKK